MALFQITVPDEIAADWRAQAEAMGLANRIGAWIRLQVAAAQKQQDAVAFDPQPLSTKLLNVVGTGLAKRDVPKLARQLGVPARSVHAALGSLVARKRLARDGNEYRLIGG